MKWGKGTLIIIGALVVTALGIDAADTFNGNQGTLLGQLVGSEVAETCPEGMLQIGAPTTFTCVDIYEATMTEACGDLPQNELETATKLQNQSCRAISQKDAAVWRFVTREQAAIACARSGKRLPTAAEWYQFAIGTPDTQSVCNISSGSTWNAGQSNECVSATGVYDAVGNVWEWTKDDVIDGSLDGQVLPVEGYVAQVDGDGIATVTEETNPQQFGGDYFWSKPEGAYAVMRGGFYGSQSDAGVYALHAATNPSLSGAAIGFRCIK